MFFCAIRVKCYYRPSCMSKQRLTVLIRNLLLAESLGISCTVHGDWLNSW